MHDSPAPVGHPVDGPGDALEHPADALEQPLPRRIGEGQRIVVHVAIAVIAL